MTGDPVGSRTSDLISRLRAAPPFDPENRKPGDSIYQLCAAAADEIEALRGALRDLVEWWEKDGGNVDSAINRGKQVLANGR